MLHVHLRTKKSKSHALVPLMDSKKPHIEHIVDFHPIVQSYAMHLGVVAYVLSIYA
jgi:hypothetical protein